MRSATSPVGRRKALDFVEYGPLLAEMRGKRREWPKRYGEFVESGLVESDPYSTGYDVRCGDFKVALKESPRSSGSGSAVCKQLNRLPDKLSKDRRLRRQLNQAEIELNAAPGTRVENEGA